MSEFNAQFNWKCFAETEKFVCEILEKYCDESAFLSSLKDKLKISSSTDLIVWVDHLVIESINVDLSALGYREEKRGHYSHSEALFPSILIGEKNALFLKVDSIAYFQMVHGCQGKIEGTPFSAYRTALVNDGPVDIYIVERRGSKGIYQPAFESSQDLLVYLKAKELWSLRPRGLDHEKEAMKQTLEIAKQIRQWVGNKASSIVLEVEREYWQHKNRAAQIQKARQDSVGMGWANHDHHTFRASRTLFRSLVELFEILGFVCRERFYTGKEAGWGAQVMEDVLGGFVLFLDVDLEPHELAIDFAHQELPPIKHLGTVGLWCALHGDSILHGGMHHLECQFNFDALREDLAKQGVGMMQPFSHFSYLKQAFTAGEWWPVSEQRIADLLHKQLINAEEAEVFRTKGAVGSHLENLERHEGYKGFNQKNVSFIIQQTDPRTLQD